MHSAGKKRLANDPGVTKLPLMRFAERATHPPFSTETCDRKDHQGTQSMAIFRFFAGAKL